MQHIAEATFWVALGKIIWVNILLSGDNAVVIALAARNLPEQQRKQAVLYGSAAAIVLRVVLTLFAVQLLHYPYLKIIGAALLFWIGVQLLVPEKGDGEGGGVKSSEHLFAAIRTILIADLVMSLDNVIAVAAAAESGPPESRTLLLIIGLGLSIPLIIFGSQLLMQVMERFPIIITLGAALLGFVAGEMLVHDQAVEQVFIGLGGATTTIVELAGAVAVVLVGRWMAMRTLAAPPPAAAPVAAAPAAAPGHISNVLLAVDASENASRAVQRLITLRDDLRGGLSEVHLVNVQRSLPSDVSNFVPHENIESYHRERSENATAPARKLLDAAGIRYAPHLLVGDPGLRIAQLAQSQGCDLIVMGTRGLGSHTGALLGSVAQATVEHTNVPVMLVK